MQSGNVVSLDFASLSPSAIYKLMIGAIVPRPIAFVSTVSARGIGNLAPFSFYNAVSNDPPCIVFSIARKGNGEKKDTLRNIEETGGFVVNSASEWMAEAMNQTSADYPYGVDEMLHVGLTPVPSVKIKAFRVKEAAIQMECELYKTVELSGSGPGATTLVIGRIVMMHVAEKAYADGKIRIEELKPLSRLAGAAYGKIGEIFELPRAKIVDMG